MKERNILKGDRFVAVGLVDLAVSLFTLGVPFFDAARPYLYQKLGNRRIIKFYFEEKSNAFAGDTVPLIKEWPSAEVYCEPLTYMSICKRVIWERRWLLTEIGKGHLANLQMFASGLQVIENVKEASVAYALGFRKPDQPIVNDNGKPVFLVGTNIPPWLKPYCSCWNDIADMLEAGISFIEKPENEAHPVAIASAVFINITAWLDHLRTDKPYMQFTTATGKSYWVREGSDKWSELVGLGYSPH